MTNHSVTLPSKDEILKRLKKADGKVPHRERLFEMIAERGGGQQHDATGIATLVATAIEVYMRGDHLCVQGGIHPGVLTQLKEKAPSYIDVLTENNSVRAAAKREFEEIPIILNEP